MVDTLNTNFGVVNVVLSRYIPKENIVLFNDGYVDLVALRDAHFEPLAKTGDSVKGQVVGEYSLKVASPKAVAILKVV
ncbi:DUF5309 family protein [Lysinibacillus sp. NPDC097868]|uniref:SU10 major capsid protein n=1 Tax=Lysinibacillus sp. NPDC097868 TaxID=3364145 RepID=UPI00381EA0A9